MSADLPASVNVISARMTRTKTPASTVTSLKLRSAVRLPPRRSAWWSSMGGLAMEVGVPLGCGRLQHDRTAAPGGWCGRPVRRWGSGADQGDVRQGLGLEIGRQRRVAELGGQFLG